MLVAANEKVASGRRILRRSLLECSARMTKLAQLGEAALRCAWLTPEQTSKN
jgi:hypothetical protein